MSLSTADPEDLAANSVLLERVIDLNRERIPDPLAMPENPCLACDRTERR